MSQVVHYNELEPEIKKRFNSPKKIQRIGIIICLIVISALCFLAFLK